MKRLLTAVLSVVAAFGIATTGRSLTIVPTFDSSITTDPNGAAMMTAINAAIQVFQTNYTDNLTVTIFFTNNPTMGLGQSSTYYSDYAYSDFITALRSRATSTNDTYALSKLTNNTVDPVVGGTMIRTTLAHARLLGLDTSYGTGGLDSTITLNMSLMNFTRPATNSNNYDLQAVVEHEIDEVLGTSSRLPTSNDDIRPVDLFRYDTNLNRTFTTNGDNAYFSPDGTNLVARYNQQSDGSDYGDWWGGVGGGSYWAPPGKTPHPQVQDAYGTTGGFEDLGVSELTVLDVIGYTLASTPVAPSAPTITVVAGKGQITLSWATNFNGYQLQERTNLTSGNWSNSVTGTTNPAVLLTSAAQKFYQLYYQPPVQAVGFPRATQAQASPATPYKLETHVLLPRRF